MRALANNALYEILKNVYNWKVTIYKKKKNLKKKPPKKTNTKISKNMQGCGISID